jgi:hypothetical protein
MKIHVLKKASGRVKVSDPCPFLVEIPPEASKK